MVGLEKMGCGASGKFISRGNRLFGRGSLLFGGFRLELLPLSSVIGISQMLDAYNHKRVPHDSARDPFERFSILVTRLQSLQIAGVPTEAHDSI